MLKFTFLMCTLNHVMASPEYVKCDLTTQSGVDIRTTNKVIMGDAPLTATNLFNFTKHLQNTAKKVYASSASHSSEVSIADNPMDPLWTPWAHFGPLYEPPNHPNHPNNSNRSRC